jgi:hypothetical protein
MRPVVAMISAKFIRSLFIKSHDVTGIVTNTIVLILIESLIAAQCLWSS